jgi:hypothetical protein
MGRETAPKLGALPEMHFSDKDAGSRLPTIPEGVKPPAASVDKATIDEWAAQAGHLPPRHPPGGYRHRGERPKGFDVRILHVHLRAHATKERPYYVNALYTREEYDALVKEARGVSLGNASEMRDRVESVVAYRGGFITREEHARLTAAPSVKET